MYFVYVLGCLETRRVYIGQTDHLIRRFDYHVQLDSRSLHGSNHCVLWIDLNRTKDEPLYQQIIRQLTDRILHGELPAGTRLPSSRQLSNDLGVSRNVVNQVYEQLYAEGFIITRRNSGTFVAEGVEFVPEGPAAAQAGPLSHPTASHTAPRIEFRTGNPDLASFPRERWYRCYRQTLWYQGATPADYGDVQGSIALRSEIARHILAAKNIRVSPQQIFIDSGTAQSLQILSHHFAPQFSRLYVEECVVDFVPTILGRTANRDIVPVPIDPQGMQPDEIQPPSGLIVVTPSHQFPSGSTLPIQRRIRLVQRTKQFGSWIIEDDYDSEFRYEGSPIASLQHLDPTCVIHLGTFSKTLGPGLRLAYMVVPNALVEPFIQIKESLHLSSPVIDQETLALFMREGYFARHIARMKKRYQTRMQCLVTCLRTQFGDAIEVSGNTTGMHLMVRFKKMRFHHDLRQRIRDRGVGVEYYDDYLLSERSRPDCLILGFGNLDQEEIREGVRLLAAAI